MASCRMLWIPKKKNTPNANAENWKPGGRASKACPIVMEAGKATPVLRPSLLLLVAGVVLLLMFRDFRVVSCSENRQPQAFSSVFVREVFFPCSGVGNVKD